MTFQVHTNKNECARTLIRSCKSSHSSCNISYASMTLSSRMSASARILAFSSLGGSSANKTATSRMFCLSKAAFLFEAI